MASQKNENKGDVEHNVGITVIYYLSVLILLFVSTASSYILLSVLSTTAMSKGSRKASMKVIEISRRTTTVGGGCVVYCLNVTS